MKKLLTQYVPPLFTLLLVALGAAMPWLSSAVQDARIGKLQEDLDLNTVSLTLLQNEGLEQSLRIASSEYVNLPWSGGTALTEEQARQTAVETLDEMYSFGLIEKKNIQILNKTGVTVEPCLMAAEDGTALVWDCRWADGDTDLCVITVDDASGKAVQIYAGISAEADVEMSAQIMGGLTIYGGTKSVENCWALMEMWASFLEYYYGASLMTVTELEYFPDGGANFLLELEFYNDGTIQACALPLEVYSDGVRFNF